jgi:hypothetical protein
VRHRARRAHTTARRHLHIACVHTRLIEVARRTRVHEPQRKPVIALSRPRLPRRLLTGHHRRQSVQIQHHTSIDGLVESE